MARITLRKVFSLLAGAVMVFAAGSAAAQTPRCAPRSELVSALGETYKEQQNAYGWISPSAILEVFASEKGSWTVIVTGADGVSCILAVGIGWEQLPALVGETGLHGSM